MSDDTRFINLETKIAYQDNLIDELNKVVTSQQDQIDQLIKQVKQLSAGLQGVNDALRLQEQTDEAPPPHY